MSTRIALGNASYGFREYTVPEFFAASREIGLTLVEIDCGWLEEESRNKIAVDATPRSWTLCGAWRRMPGSKSPLSAAGRWSGCTGMWPKIAATN